jgi:hypothetical protein
MRKATTARGRKHSATFHQGKRTLVVWRDQRHQHFIALARGSEVIVFGLSKGRAHRVAAVLAGVGRAGK